MDDENIKIAEALELVQGRVNALDEIVTVLKENKKEYEALEKTRVEVETALHVIKRFTGVL